MSGKKYPFMTMEEVREAQARIAPLVQRTPVIRDVSLSEKVGASIFFKLETLHDVGSFKIRGAANKMQKLTAAEKERGVTTYSTGNHGLAVAFVARQLSIRAVICISDRVPHTKVEALTRLGAELEIVGGGQDGATERCRQLREEEGLTVIPPFDDRDIIAGQATIAMEIMESLPSVDEVMIPLSGGGLLAGVGFAIKQLKPAVKVTGVSIEGASAMHASLEAGKPVMVAEKETLADSLLGGINLDNRYTFPMVQTYMDELLLLSEKAILRGMTHLLEKERIVAEGAGAAGVAALLERQQEPLHSNIAVIVSGSNLDWKQFKQAAQLAGEEGKHDCFYGR